MSWSVLLIPHPSAHARFLPVLVQALRHLLRRRKCEQCMRVVKYAVIKKHEEHADRDIVNVNRAEQ